MARISTYASDADIGKQDKVIGTDSNQSATRNYTFEQIGNYINDYNVVSILGQNNFRFQSGLSPQLDRKLGSVSFETYGGIGTSLSAITELIFSGSNTAEIAVSNFIASLVGKELIFTDLGAQNNFAVYRLNAFTELTAESGFYKAELTFQSGSGVIREDAVYGLALYSLGGGTEWGNITGTLTDQTDLINYITNAVPDVPYETAQDIVDALNSFGNAGFALSTVPQFSRGIEIGVDDTNNSVYSLPDGGLESELPGITDKFGYFLLTDSEGNLYWKNFPLEFLAGLDEEAAVDGGTF